MAAGVAVVATRVGGIPEIVSDEESALLVEPGDIPAMGRALARVLSPDRSLAEALARRSRILVQERHAPEARVRKLAGIYHDIVG
jgi:glycosyltransferase involved in cell wall biosynthesis